MPKRKRLKKDKFCKNLRKMIKEEEGAGDAYRKLAQELRADPRQELGEGLDDAYEIETIATNEDAHFSILSDMFDKRCRKNRRR